MTCAGLHVRDMRTDDWPQVRHIYQAGIDTGRATFTDRAPAYEAWDAAHLRICRLVAEADGALVGFAVLSPYSARKPYRGVAELSVYVDPGWQGRGAGRALLGALIDESERQGLWTLQAGIFTDNEASVRLHRACGFRLVGVRERIAMGTDGAWRDVALYERRSTRTGQS